jgi:hypothetical protein
VLTGTAGCRETIIINGRQITLQANTNDVTVDLLRSPSGDLLDLRPDEEET